MIVSVLLWLASVPGVSFGMLPTAPNPQALGAKMPAYAVVDDADKMLNLKQIEGPILINIWASWCRACVHELPVLASLHRTWKPRGLSVIGVSVDKIKTTTRQLIAAHQLPYPVVYDHANLAADLLAVQLIPSTYLYDRQHRLVFFRPNVVQSDDPELKAALEKVTAL